MRVVIAVVALAIVGIMSTMVLQAAIVEVGDGTQNVNETFTPVSGSVTNLSDSQLENVRYNGSQGVTVYDENDTKMSQPADYQWNANNGTIRTNSTGDLAGDTSANITYGYVTLTEEQAQLEYLASWIPRLIGPALLFGLVIVLGVFLWG